MKLTLTTLCFLGVLQLVDNAPVTSKYQMEKTWKMDPNSNNLALAKDAKLDRLKVVPDPFENSGENVFQVSYPKGSYSPSGSNKEGGVNFYSQPFGTNGYQRAILTYEVGFKEGFNFVEGGKLPGLYAGEAASGCSGGNQSDGKKCFSTRLMWRQSGAGEVYDYLPKQGDSFCKTTDVVCNKDYGTSIGRDKYKFSTGWNQVHMFVQVNDVGSSNGNIELYINKTKVLAIDSLTYRTNPNLGIQSLMFSTFFGGSEPRFATPVDAYVYFRNIEFGVADECGSSKK
ncbi:hypothetical protein K7432_007651 [Basidiobolus ranarum]|uniref:Polysaccharide lyase 14 domain-containing protein n=1 Tax=Basidiobolus ranarum TaxID=34480 RepID=A0ABR2WT57_9FUNG